VDPDRTPEAAGERGISRHGLELVIRRAAELYAAETDSRERLSEDEVLRIAAELGLPAHHVQQALYELPRAQEQEQARWPTRVAEHYYGPGSILATRVIGGDPAAVEARIERYLTTREYLQLRRRQPGRLWLEPAEDALSSVARAIGSLGRPYHLARADHVMVAVRPLEEGRTHVGLDVDLEDRRRSAVRSGLAGGTVAGMVVGGTAFLAVGLGMTGVAGPEVGMAVGALAGLGGLGSTIAGSLKLAGSRFRRRVAAIRLATDGFLDRLEQGDRLEPPPAPWRRRLGA
jgi:hypothetical protein